MRLHNDLIMELQGFVPESFCNHLINKFENDDRKNHGSFHKGDKKVMDTKMKESIDLPISRFDEWSEEDKLIYKYIGDSVKIYNKYIHEEYGLFSELKNICLYDDGYIIGKQLKDNNGLLWHYDLNLNPESYVSGILYLNTLESHEGGCTEFLNGRKIRPECGKIMIFPMNWTYPHRGNYVKSDYRYILTFSLYFSEFDPKFKGHKHKDLLTLINR